MCILTSEFTQPVNRERPSASGWHGGDATRRVTFWVSQGCPGKMISASAGQYRHIVTDERDTLNRNPDPEPFANFVWHLSEG
eukprot:1393600-Amorphochlora_amoeboformis.AAC.1